MPGLLCFHWYFWIVFKWGHKSETFIQHIAKCDCLEAIGHLYGLAFCISFISSIGLFSSFSCLYIETEEIR